jgi:ABC-type lipopolysaccharide export system ATPase subunit
LSAIGENLLGNAQQLFSDFDISAFTDFDASALLGGAEEVIEIAQEYAAEAFEFIASFW